MIGDSGHVPSRLVWSMLNDVVPPDLVSNTATICDFVAKWRIYIRCCIVNELNKDLEFNISQSKIGIGIGIWFIILKSTQKRLYMISRYCTWNDYTWWHLTGSLVLLRGLIIRVIEKRPRMVYCSPGISFTRTHYEVYTYRLCNLDDDTIQVSQLCFIEHPMYSHWAVFPLNRQVKDVAIPYAGVLALISFLLIAHTWPLFARTC